MSLSLKHLRVGQTVTLVSKGVRNSEVSGKWIDEYLIGETSFLQITRIGKQYIYGKYITFNDDGEKMVYDWETRINPEEYIILDGIRTDMEQQYLNYRRQLNEYEEKRRQAQQQFEIEAREMVMRKMEEWTKQNPRPKPPDINQLTNSKTTPLFYGDGNRENSFRENR